MLAAFADVPVAVEPVPVVTAALAVVARVAAENALVEVFLPVSVAVEAAEALRVDLLVKKDPDKPAVTRMEIESRRWTY